MVVYDWRLIPCCQGLTGRRSQRSLLGLRPTVWWMCHRCMDCNRLVATVFHRSRFAHQWDDRQPFGRSHEYQPHSPQQTHVRSSSVHPWLSFVLPWTQWIGNFLRLHFLHDSERCRLALRCSNPDADYDILAPSLWCRYALQSDNFFQLLAFS